jgi:hypothetical protein
MGKGSTVMLSGHTWPTRSSTPFVVCPETLVCECATENENMRISGAQNQLLL